MAANSTLFNKFGKRIKPDQIIFKEGDAGEKMYIIQKGKVKITKKIQGKEHILAIMDKGDFFGEMALVMNINRSATATAVDKVELLEFDRRGFLNMVEKNAKVALSIIDKLCKRLYKTTRQIKHFVKKNERALFALSIYYAFKGLKRADKSVAYEDTIEEISIDLDLPKQRILIMVEDLIKKGILNKKADKLYLANEKKLNSIIEVI